MNARERGALAQLEDLAREAVVAWKPAPYTAGASIHRRLGDTLEVLERIRTETPVDPAVPPVQSVGRDPDQVT